MIGTLCVISKKRELVVPNSLFNEKDGLFIKKYQDINAFFSLVSLEKFNEDKVFLIEDNLVVVFDGVIFNDIEIKAKYGNDSLEKIIKDFIDKNSLSEFLNELRGSFYGIVFNRESKDIICFTDHWSSKPLFYYLCEDIFLIGSEVNTIAEILNENGYKYSLNRIGAYSLLTNAYMYMDNTLVDGIKRIQPGLILMINNEKFSYHKYHEWSKSGKKIDYREAVDKLDVLFVRAVRRQTDKNERNGYINVIPLSAGLDCRIVSFVAKKMGIGNVINYTYSESDQDDERLPKIMANYLGNILIYKNLDNGLDLMDIEQSIDIADGLIYYPWVSQLNGFLKLVDTKLWGIVHTGVVGDVIIGCFIRNFDDIKRRYKFGDGAYSNKLVEKLAKEVVIGDWSYEEGMLLNRAINGACMGYSTSFRRYTESFSPFMDVDFADFCFSLPYEYRIRHRIYYEWVKCKYPDAAKFPHNGIKISTGRIYNIGKKSFRMNTIFDIVKKRVNEKKKPQYGMNPMDYWYQNNLKLKSKMDTYFAEKVYYIDDAEIKKDVIDLYEKGNAVEKTMAISFIGSYINLFKSSGVMSSEEK